MQIKRKPIIDEQVAKAFTAVKDLDRGEVIRFDLIKRTAGVSRESEHWNTFIKKLKRKMLRERGIELWAVTDVGFRLSTHHEQLRDNANKRLRRASRQAMRAEQSVTALPQSELGHHMQVERAGRIQSLNRTKRYVRTEVRVINALMKVPESRPQ